MPNDNRQMGVTHQRAILYELKCIKELLKELNTLDKLNEYAKKGYLYGGFEEVEESDE